MTKSEPFVLIITQAELSILENRPQQTPIIPRQGLFRMDRGNLIPPRSSTRFDSERQRQWLIRDVILQWVGNRSEVIIDFLFGMLSAFSNAILNLLVA